MLKTRKLADMETVPLSVAIAAKTGDFNSKSDRVFSDAAVMLRGILQDLHCTHGEFTLRPLNQVKASARWTRIHVRGESTHNRDSSFHVRLRPGDNNSTWEYVLTVPSGMSAVTLQEQLRLFAERCRGREEGHIDPVIEETEAMPPIDEATPPPHIVTPSVAPTTGPVAELGGLFQRIQSALVRKESRAQRAAGITRAIDAERKKIEYAQTVIARLEEDWIAVQQEDETDAESKEAEALLGTLRLFSKPVEAQAAS